MKKVLKRAVIPMLAVTAVVMTGCGDKQMQQEDIDVNSLLQEVTQKPVTNTEETTKETSKETSENISYDALLQGGAKLQTLDGKSVSLAELAGNSDVNYVIMDLDKDGEEELFILASPVSALIKNVDGEYKMIYDGCGYDVPINTDGLTGVLYAYPGAAPLHDIFRYTEFESGKKNSETVASWYDAGENGEMDSEDCFYLGEDEKEVTMEEWLAAAGKLYEHRNDDLDWKVIAGEESSEVAVNEITLTAKVHNDYFFAEGSKEYTYKVKNFFFEDPDEITVKLELIANYEKGDVYSLTVQYKDIPERTAWGMDRYALGTFYVTEDSIYMEEQCEKIPTEEEFINNSMIVYSASEKPQNHTDYETRIEEDGDNYKFSFWNPLVESGYYCNMTWTKDKGLTYFRNGFGAEAAPIEIELLLT